MISLVYSLKCICFTLIGFCVSELHGYLYPYRNVWSEAVYCCFYIVYRMYSTVVIDVYQYTKFRFSTLSDYWVETEEEEQQQQQ